MAARNADSMTNAQGEFHPTKPRDEPETTSGHQPGKLVGNDAAPEFHAQTLPAGTAPKESTFEPNPISETPGQANNPDVSASNDKEDTSVSAADTLTGATSADVHTGLGHPGSNQSSAEARDDTKGPDGLDGPAKAGGLGMAGEPESAEAKALRTDHPQGPKAAQEHNPSVQGAETKLGGREELSK